MKLKILNHISPLKILNHMSPLKVLDTKLIHFRLKKLKISQTKLGNPIMFDKLEKVH